MTRKAAKLKVVMDWRHTENPLATRQLEVSHLHHNRSRFKDIDDSDEKQGPLLVQGNREGSKHTTQGKTSHVPHKDFSWLMVKDKEA